MKILCRIIASCMLLGATSLYAYESQTHAYITYQAFVNSNLDNSNAAALFQQLGLDRLDASQPFISYWTPPPFLGGFYFDNLPSGSTPLQYERPVYDYEWYQMQQLVNSGMVSSTVIGQTSFQTLPIVNWLIRGAIREDDLPLSAYSPIDGPVPDSDPYGDIYRVFNHFYDPIHNQGFVPPAPTICNGSYGPCQPSVDWALGTIDAFASLSPDSNRRQHFSWEDARQNEYLALIAERDTDGDGVRNATEREADSEERLYRWATTFRSLGDVVHLLQDTAQPQHTRNDRHDPYVGPIDQQGFEPFTNYRLIGQAALAGANPTGGQVYVRSLTGKGSLFQQFFTPLPDINGYPVPMFTTPLRFFTTRDPNDGPGVLPDNRYGMADYSNRGFFTRGTPPNANTLLPGVFAYAEPDPSTLTTQKVTCDLVPAIGGLPVYCQNGYHTVPDPVQPGRADATTQEPLATWGIWLEFNGGITPGVGYTLTPQTYQMMGNLTVPRAIAYSAGLINYFFRGRLSVTAPADGLYAVVNHGTPHTVNAQGYPCQGTATADGCPVFGFEQVRLNVRNATAAMTESGTGNPISKATGGTGAKLVAVARYHLNPCYKPDLTGEYAQDESGTIHPPTGCTQGIRTPYQEISVSASIAVTPGMLDGTQPVALTFDFSADPIPVNATDLFLQAVYRGPLGDEPDSIAVGTVDVSEPTYLAIMNGTDYVLKNGQWVVPTGTDPASVAFTSIGICSAGSQIFAASTPGLPVTHVLRLAALRDFTNQNFAFAVTTADGMAFGNEYDVWHGIRRQADDEKGTAFHLALMFYARGEVFDDFGTYYYRHVPPLPDPIPSPRGLSTPATAISENLGAVVAPGTTACPF